MITEKDYIAKVGFGVHRAAMSDPPSDSNYDNYGSTRIPRISKNGIYQEIKLLRGEKPVGDPNKFAKALVDMNTIIAADIQLNSFVDRTNGIIKAINSQQSNNVILIGSLLPKTGIKQWNLVCDFVPQLFAQNVFLILGCYDIYSPQDYINFGFKYVTDRAEKTLDITTRLIYTQFPVPCKFRDFNIHGHPHDNLYRYISHEKHFDARVVTTTNRTRVYTLGEIMQIAKGGNNLNG